VRKDYLVFDRGRLAYLNTIEKVGCIYCSYANGLLAMITEIAARTEQHFCPIKHAHTLKKTHSRYPTFLPYGKNAFPIPDVSAVRSRPSLPGAGRRSSPGVWRHRAQSQVTPGGWALRQLAHSLRWLVLSRTISLASCHLLSSAGKKNFTGW